MSTSEVIDIYHANTMHDLWQPHAHTLCFLQVKCLPLAPCFPLLFHHKNRMCVSGFRVTACTCTHTHTHIWATCLYDYSHGVIRMQVCKCAAPIEQKILFTHDWFTERPLSLLNRNAHTTCTHSSKHTHNTHTHTGTESRVLISVL